MTSSKDGGGTTSKNKKSVWLNTILFCGLLGAAFMGGWVANKPSKQDLEIIEPQPSLEETITQHLKEGNNLQQNTTTTQEDEQKNTEKAQNSNQPYVASSRGSKYYPILCKAVDSIKETNKIYFSSEQEAQQQGYSRTTSKQCKW